MPARENVCSLLASCGMWADTCKEMGGSYGVMVELCECAHTCLKTI